MTTFYFNDAMSDKPSTGSFSSLLTSLTPHLAFADSSPTFSIILASPYNANLYNL
jgi:hypothetical protein